MVDLQNALYLLVKFDMWQFAPGLLGCLFLLGIYRAELKTERMRVEIAKKMNWTIFLKQA